MAEELKREFGGLSDAKMLTNADTFSALFDEDTSAFEAFDSALIDAYHEQFRAAITAAREVATDETEMDEIAALTALMNAAWNNCKTHFQGAKYFIDLAFPNDKPKQNSFGYDDYGSMSREQDQVIGFMDQFYSASHTHSALLIAQGYTQVKIDAIPTLTEAFRTAQTAQEVGIKKRPVKTQARITAMNLVWSYIKRINKASKQVYRTDFAKLQQYLLPGAGTNEPVENLAVVGLVTNSINGQPVPGAVVRLADLGLQAVADDTGAYGFAMGVPDGITPLTADAMGFQDFSVSITVVEGETLTRNVVMVPV